MIETIELENNYMLKDIVVCALRYALGRHTYTVDEVCEFIENNPALVDERTFSVMLRDIDERLMEYERTGEINHNLYKVDYDRIVLFRERLVLMRFHKVMGEDNGK